MQFGLMKKYIQMKNGIIRKYYSDSPIIYTKTGFVKYYCYGFTVQPCIRLDSDINNIKSLFNISGLVNDDSKLCPFVPFSMKSLKGDLEYESNNHLLSIQAFVYIDIIVVLIFKDLKSFSKQISKCKFCDIYQTPSEQLDQRIDKIFKTEISTEILDIFFDIKKIQFPEIYTL